MQEVLLFARLFYGNGNFEHGASHALSFFGRDAGHLHTAILYLAQLGEDRALLFVRTVLP